MNTPTPGTWKVEIWNLGEDKRPQVVVTSDKDAIAYVKDLWPCGERNGEVAANAHLLAAAPDMLTALKGLLADKYLSDPINADRMLAARAAITKAEGNT